VTFTIHELPRAIEDKDEIAAWLANRSPQGAAAWLDAFRTMVQRLQVHAAGFARASESDGWGEDVREAMFKTRRGNAYRALFLVEGNDVFLLRIHGPGQAPVSPEDLR
jgi:plasmid stabilization system protein ParE